MLCRREYEYEWECTVLANDKIDLLNWHINHYQNVKLLAAILLSQCLSGDFGKVICWSSDFENVIIIKP